MDFIMNDGESLNIPEDLFKKEAFAYNAENPPTNISKSDDEIKLDPSLHEDFELKDEYDSDVESDGETNTKKVEKTSAADETISWPQDDLTQLIHRIELALPEKDKLAYNTRVEKLEWEEVKFKEYSSADCKKTWLQIQKRVRRFRLLNEVLQDAKEWVSKPWTDYYRRKKTKHCPYMPRRPLTVYMLFYLQMKDQMLARDPTLDMAEVTKEISLIYKKLSPEEREKYTNLAMSQRKNYEEQMDEFYRMHPEIPRNMDKLIDVKPKKPSTPFYLFYKDQLKNPDMDNSTFKDACKKVWKTLPDKEKLVWINLALDLEAKYQEDVKSYVDHNPDFSPPVLKPILTKEEKALKEKLAGKPVKPPTSAYSLFTAMMLQSDEIKKIPPKERMKAVADEWKNSTDEEKKPFQVRVNELMKQYKKDLASYLKSLPTLEKEDGKKPNEVHNVPKRKSIDKSEGSPNKKKKPSEEEKPETTAGRKRKSTDEMQTKTAASPGRKRKSSVEARKNGTPAARKRKPSLGGQTRARKTVSDRKRKSNEDESTVAIANETDSTPTKEEQNNTNRLNEMTPDNIKKEVTDSEGEPMQAETNTIVPNKNDLNENAQATQPEDTEIAFDNTKLIKKENVADEVPIGIKTELMDFTAVFKREPPQPPISGFSLFHNIYEGSIPVNTAWRRMSKLERDEYEERVKKLKLKYIREYENFLKSLTKEQLLVFSRMKQEKQNDSADSDGSASENE